jgi:hypothetical protein
MEYCGYGDKERKAICPTFDVLYNVTLGRGLVPCCRQVAAGALCRGGRVCGGGIAGNVEAEASRRDGQLRHHTSQHGVSRTGSSRVTQAWLS